MGLLLQEGGALGLSDRFSALRPVGLVELRVRDMGASLGVRDRTDCLSIVTRFRVARPSNDGEPSEIVNMPAGMGGRALVHAGYSIAPKIVHAHAHSLSGQ